MGRSGGFYIGFTFPMVLVDVLALLLLAQNYRSFFFLIIFICSLFGLVGLTIGGASKTKGKLPVTSRGSSTVPLQTIQRQGTVRQDQPSRGKPGLALRTWTSPSQSSEQRVIQTHRQTTEECFDSRSDMLVVNCPSCQYVFFSCEELPFCPACGGKP